MTSNTGIVKLKIGGTIFQTTKSTLTRFDGFFRTVIETHVPVTKDDSGAFFIDRSPKHFDLILNFMRDGNVKIPSSEREIDEISIEAQYYLLTGLVDLCSKQSEVQPNTEMFKVLHSESEIFHAVLHSKKPVLVIFLIQCSHLCHKDKTNKWKQFFERHSIKWNIFLKEANCHQYLLHADGKETVWCALTGFPMAQCSPEWKTIFEHLEHHMNKFS